VQSGIVNIGNLSVVDTLNKYFFTSIAYEFPISALKWIIIE